MKASKLITFLMIMAAISSACANNRQSLLKPVEFGEMIESDKDIVVLDVRTAEEFKEAHFPGAINIDALQDEFIENVSSRIPSGSKVALYCRSGRRSAEAASEMQQKGYDVTDLDGGILAWEKAGLTVTTGPEDLYWTTGGKQIAIEPLIHASIRIVFDGKEIEVDPVGTLGDRSTDYSRFPKADLILVTHEHHDHLDPSAIKELSKPDTIVIANKNSADILGYGKVMANGDRLTWNNGIEIEAVPAYNTYADKLQFHPKGRDNGYVLTLDGFRIYIAGDTEPISEMKDLKDIDIAFMPCNLPYTMTPDQLIEAAKMVKPKVLYPYHFGSTDISAIPAALAPEGIYVRICPFDP